MSHEVRIATPHDAKQVADIYAPFVRDTPVSFETEPPDAEAMRERIAATLEKYPWLVADDDGQVPGYAYATQHRTRPAYQWCVETSVYVSPQHRRHGVARGLYAALLEVLQLQGFYNAYAGIALPNSASVALHEACGFAPIGVYPGIGYKLGAWHDVGWWHLVLQAPTVTPTAPLPLPTLRDQPTFADALAAGRKRWRSCRSHL